MLKQTEQAPQEIYGEHCLRKNHRQELVLAVEKQMAKFCASLTKNIFTLAELAESRDPEIGSHLERVSVTSALLAGAWQKVAAPSEKLPEHFVENIRQTSVLHDIGKIGISNNILLKPDGLTGTEFEIIKTHTLIGTQIVAAMKEGYPSTILNMALEIIRSHHECWDGSGYPNQLVGTAIPLSARIMAVADVYDALTSARPYKSPCSSSEAYDIILKGSGSHFDPMVISAFAKCRSRLEEIASSWIDEV